MTLTAVQRRIGLACALVLAIAVTMVGDDKSIQAETKKPPAAGPDELDAVRPPRAEAAADKAVPIEMAKLTRVPPASGGVDVFAAKSWARPAAARAAVSLPPPLPVAPPLPFQFVGQIHGREGPTILLARGEESLSVKAGEAIDGEYRLESITDEVLTFVYLPLNERQTLGLEAK